MAKSVRPIPEGYHAVTPYIIVTNAREALKFYHDAFGAKELMHIDGPGGKIMHAEIRIGNSCIMLTDEHPEMKALAPKTLGGSPVSLMIYVENVDEIYKKAV